MEKKMRRMRNLLVALVFGCALVTLAGFGQMAVDEVKDARKAGVITKSWKEKTSMKHETVGLDFSDEEPMIQELLIAPMEIERIG
jgi:hypothetical protein